MVDIMSDRTTFFAGASGSTLEAMMSMTSICMGDGGHEWIVLANNLVVPRWNELQTPLVVPLQLTCRQEGERIGEATSWLVSTTPHLAQTCWYMLKVALKGIDRLRKIFHVSFRLNLGESFAARMKIGHRDIAIWVDCLAY